jgi:hypothetical protein
MSNGHQPALAVYPRDFVHRFFFALTLGSLACAATIEPFDGAPARPNAPRSVVAARISASSIGGTEYFSSTQLRVSWSAPESGAVPRYEVSWGEAASPSRSSRVVTATTLDLADLAAGTAYRIDVAPCSAINCSTSDTTSIATQTPAEVWQMQGSGSSIAGLTRIVSDGNVKIHVLRYGIGSASAGRMLMYYGPMQQTAKGLAVATTATTANYLNFDSRAGSAGLVSPPSAATLVREVATGQGVPLAANMGGRIRLFFEAAGADGRTRIMSLDSQDGYTGFDFNGGASGVCATQADYATGGGCAPTIAIGVDGDATAPNARIPNARQFKIGVPTMTDWRWDGAAGTFMVFTTDLVTGCSTAQPNQGYAVWSGNAWQVQYQTNGCPKLFPSMQAAHPLHLGGTRFKMYYGDPSDQAGRVAGSNLPFLGPKKVIYANGARSGDPNRVDFEDWDPPSAGRRLVFLWPNGSPLNATAIGYIDDFSVVMPTGVSDVQVLYVAITDGTVAPFASAAILINP